MTSAISSWLYVAAYLCCTFVIFTGCKTTQAQSDSHALTALVKEKLGDSTVTEENHAGTYRLVEQSEKSKIAGQPIRYIVIRLKDNKVVYEGRFRRGHVKWLDNETIEVLSVPGKVRWNDDMNQYKKKINILSPSSPADL